jgi:hypothetical protein
MKETFRVALLGTAMVAAACCGVPANAIRAPRVELPNVVRAAIFRSTRALTQEEVFVAIRGAMEGAGYSGAPSVSADDVLLQSQILVAPGDAGLEIVRSDFDPGMKRGRFLLRASRDPSVLPFYALVQFREGSGSAGFLAAIAIKDAPSQQHLRAAPRKAKPEILVAPNQTATLVLRSESLSMVTDVVPLERGAIGQQVRVRAADTGKIFRARVDGRAHLHLNF